MKPKGREKRKKIIMSMTELYKSFPDVHPNIVMQTEVLRQGIQMSEIALGLAGLQSVIIIRGSQ